MVSRDSRRQEGTGEVEGEVEEGGGLGSWIVPFSTLGYQEDPTDSRRKEGSLAAYYWTLPS
jgi:hypothetical protein